MRHLLDWFDISTQSTGKMQQPDARQVDWWRITPFIAMHLVCLAVFWVGVSPIAVFTALALYLLRMFAITAFYHRYFSHRAFKTGRITQFVFACLGAAATQRGPIWWAAQHRAHHRNADGPGDPHSPNEGFWWSHMGWFLSRGHFHADPILVKDWLKYPELRWLDRFSLLVPLLLALLLFATGWGLGHWYPGFEVTGLQLLVWGYFISTIVLLHATLTINSLAHRWGSRRFQTNDDSRNNILLAIITLGEGWHNNHHHFPAAARQGVRWWELDISYGVIWLMQKVGLVWQVKARSSAALAQEGKS